MNEAVIGIMAAILGLQVLVLASVRKKKVAPPAPAAEAALPHVDVAKLEQQAQAAFEAAVQKATATFDADLDGTSEKLNQLILRLTTDVVEKELVDYRNSLAAARQSALKSLEAMQGAVDAEQTKLQSDMAAELDKRRVYLIDKLDKKLGAAAAAYIVESLGHGADLGAQRTFLLTSLEQHKDALKKDISNDL